MITDETRGKSERVMEEEEEERGAEVKIGEGFYTWLDVSSPRVKCARNTARARQEGMNLWRGEREERRKERRGKDKESREEREGRTEEGEKGGRKREGRTEGKRRGGAGEGGSEE
ncbi:hypothetical protein WMY93_005741 [Mugilogobius chulae]|uniref:Uncharacterized protein n=1 Tax=Mugilogobius chulae TaxID=88201 RepID=A0AAW0PKF8_9GOBI